MKHLLLAVGLIACSFNAVAGECVVLLHGLARTSDSMSDLEQALTEKNYVVANIDYPSREKKIEALSETAVQAGIDKCREQSATPINIVTHSLGGILVRQYLKVHELPELKRVVMLGPPNGGSEVVDRLRDVSFFNLINGPAGSQLGTGPEDIPAMLGPVDFELGVIAGTESINPVLSTMLPDPDDGKVSVENAKIEGMCGFITLPVTHTFMMTDDEVIRQALYFLDKGMFSADEAITGPCKRSAFERPGFSG
ncbi:MAG TPA: alpha/beta hydrolase [Gammaproteobacteria bacterium]|nr:alpha/beta hydrolase [Gammaproteobacteria bacterium]